MEKIIKKKENFYLKSILFFLFAGFYFISCNSNKIEKIPEIQIIDESELKIPSNQNYIFIRLYDPVYKDKNDFGNVVKSTTEFGETGIASASHASIGFSLNDYFYGLTNFNFRDFEIEKCTDITSNDFMNRCNPDKSSCYTFAIKVNELEYLTAKNLVQNYYKDQDIKYSVLEAYFFGINLINRKYLTKQIEKHRKSKRVILTPGKLKDDYFYSEIKNKQKTFFCSSFVAYVLQNCVESVHAFFEHNQINYNYISITDLARIPNVTFLFKCSWTDYEEVAIECAKKYPELIKNE